MPLTYDAIETMVTKSELGLETKVNANKFCMQLPDSALPDSAEIRNSSDRVNFMWTNNTSYRIDIGLRNVDDVDVTSTVILPSAPNEPVCLMNIRFDFVLGDYGKIPESAKAAMKVMFNSAGIKY